MRPLCLDLEDTVRAKIGFLLICCVPAFIHPGSDAVTHAQESSKGKGRSQARLDQVAFRTAVLPLLTKYCTSCHGPTKPKAGLNLASFQDETSARSNRKAWERIKEYVEGGLMPPDDRPQPSREEVSQLTEWIKSALKADDCGRTFDPGRVTIRRLNRAEYNNTIRDLIGIDFHPADDFPSDDVGYGFDNIGDVSEHAADPPGEIPGRGRDDQRRSHRGGVVGQGHGQDVE